MKNLLVEENLSSRISFGNLFKHTAKEYSFEANCCVIQAILNYQRNFFLTGELILIKTMKLSDISQLVAKDISNISRILKNKYLLLDNKIFTVDQFLNSGSVWDCSGDQISKFQIIELIKQVIADEDPERPFSDRIIAEHIENKGICISRELVKKYRITYLKLASSTKRK